MTNIWGGMGPTLVDALDTGMIKNNTLLGLHILTYKYRSFNERSLRGACGSQKKSEKRTANYYLDSSVSSTNMT